MGLQRAVTLRDQATEILRERLLTLQYRPGDMLNQERVSEDLGISRTPVAQAFERLAMDGMVEVLPRMGVMVKPLTATDALYLSEARLSTDAMCARLAAERGTEDEIARIVQLSETGPRGATMDVKAFMMNDRKFHRAIARAAHNPVLAEIAARVHDQLIRFFFLSYMNRECVRVIHDEHPAIARAIATRDADTAERLMREHIASSRKQITTTA